jgi:ribosome-associated heat shock protein Hsp15
MEEKEKLRVDKYLWAIRIFKTRNLATDACNNGKVKCKGVNVKPSKHVRIGDQFEVKTEAKKWVVEVTALLFNRVQYSEAIKHYMDLSPVEEKQKIQHTAFVFNTGKRKTKKGRPTKKEKRKLDEFLG